MRGEFLFQYMYFLDKQIGIESLVIDWANEEAKMAKVVRNIHVFC